MSRTTSRPDGAAVQAGAQRIAEQFRQAPKQKETDQMTTTVQPAHKATVSDRIPDTAFPFRAFYYSPGMGFDTGSIVYVGRNEFRTREEAQEAAEKWVEARK